MKLSPHFVLAEFVPHGIGAADVPGEVLENLERLCMTLLEPLRAGLGQPIIITSGWRPEEKNRAVGGVSVSDHTIGKAADFYVPGRDSESWEVCTFGAYHWLRKFKIQEIGQLILEDHRHALGNPKKLWVHVALTGGKHAGANDPNQVLVSFAPGKYETYQQSLEGFA